MLCINEKGNCLHLSFHYQIRWFHWKPPRSMIQWHIHTKYSSFKDIFLGDNSAASKCKRDNGRTLVSHHLSPEFPESLKPGICSRHLPIHTLLNAYSLLTLFTLKYVFWQLHISVALGMRPVPPHPLFPPRVLGLSHLLFPFFPFLPGELD